MQRKRNTAVTSTDSDEIEVHGSRIGSCAFIMVLALILVPGYCLYLGRQEIFDAVGGARAYIYTSLLSKVADVSVVEPEDLLFTNTETKVITEITLKNGSIMQILDEPIPEDCFPEAHADYDGFAVRWGLGHKARSAAECCRRCKEFKPSQDVPSPCNVWSWCGDPSGVCWTMDIHNHTTGDCWLKFQAGWDGLTDRTATNLMTVGWACPCSTTWRKSPYECAAHAYEVILGMPAYAYAQKVNHRHKFSDEFRADHTTAPEMVPWVAGIIPPAAKTAPATA